MRYRAVPYLVETTLCGQGRERLTLQTEGWSFWQWKGHKCHYISAGEDNDGPIVVLVHGFGAHSYHWRYTVPALARQGEGATEVTTTTRRDVRSCVCVSLIDATRSISV